MCISILFHVFQNIFIFINIFSLKSLTYLWGSNTKSNKNIYFQVRNKTQNYRDSPGHGSCSSSSSVGNRHRASHGWMCCKKCTVIDNRESARIRPVMDNQKRWLSFPALILVIVLYQHNTGIIFIKIIQVWNCFVEATIAIKDIKKETKIYLC